MIKYLGWENDENRIRVRLPGPDPYGAVARLAWQCSRLGQRNERQLENHQNACARVASVPSVRQVERTRIHEQARIFVICLSSS
ncbi:hypothetical protein ANCCAN_19022 [Ancylostoma caninum]|uniref:Uncharacterized protein n=1 Tax=Ancylostoma caninum TaxID=29170 RepID=A0A368FUI1_ANCCA|nr:hypothetical protein ANCCAN_19022 [Ancylostoma caninum]